MNSKPTFCHFTWNQIYWGVWISKGVPAALILREIDFGWSGSPKTELTFNNFSHKKMLKFLWLNEAKCIGRASHFFGTNFVKATFLVMKLLNSWFFGESSLSFFYIGYMCRNLNEIFRQINFTEMQTWYVFLDLMESQIQANVYTHYTVRKFKNFSWIQFLQIYRS